MNKLLETLEKKAHTWRKRYERDLKKRYTEKENSFLIGKSKGAMDAYLDCIKKIRTFMDEEISNAIKEEESQIKAIKEGIQANIIKRFV